METFGHRFLVRVGYGEPIGKLATSGVLGDRLSPLEIATLAFDVDHRKASHVYAMAEFIVIDCERRNVKATYTRPVRILPEVQPLTAHSGWHIHREDARRYFQSLDLMPEEGTPLWCWLRRTSADQSQQLRPNQQDKADFQKLSLDHWDISPTTTITGKSGIVSIVGKSYRREYADRTLEQWAREVAPVTVRERQGRPKILSVTRKK